MAWRPRSVSSWIRSIGNPRYRHDCQCDGKRSQIYLAAGMVDMITKPIDEEDLINIILRHAGK